MEEIVSSLKDEKLTYYISNTVINDIYKVLKIRKSKINTKTFFDKKEYAKYKKSSNTKNYIHF